MVTSFVPFIYAPFTGDIEIFIATENQVKYKMRENQNRNHAIDMMKGWLAVLMTISHLTYVTSYWTNHIFTKRFNAYVNLTTFSGFLFCFGYVCWSAYIDTDKKEVEKKLLHGAVKTLAAYYVSGISYLIFYGKPSIDILSVLLLQKIPSLSEFLLSFLLIYIILLLSRKILRRMNFFWMMIASAGSLILIHIFPVEIIVSPVMGNVIGTTAYSCFPILGYLLFFLAGCSLSKYGNRLWVPFFGLSIWGTGLFIRYIMVTGTYPGRFPPTVHWIAGGMLPVCMYYFIFTLFDKIGMDIRFLEFLGGGHTLTLLVVGNVTSFALRGLTQDRIQAYMTDASDLLWFILLIGLVFGVAYFLILVNWVIKRN